jgi:ATP/maltotriose-dependent transcriptional regulator MalT
MDLIDRDDERDALDRLVASVRAGEIRALVVSAVAAQLHLSLHTVKNHVHNAFAKLGINSRAQLTQIMPGSD